MPALSKMGLYNVNIIASDFVKSKDLVRADGVATGLSGGIDSFYTVVGHLDETLKNKYSIFIFCTISKFQ